MKLIYEALVWRPQRGEGGWAAEARCQEIVSISKAHRPRQGRCHEEHIHPCTRDAARIATLGTRSVRWTECGCLSHMSTAELLTQLQIQPWRYIMIFRHRENWNHQNNSHLAAKNQLTTPEPKTCTWNQQGHSFKNYTRLEAESHRFEILVGYKQVKYWRMHGGLKQLKNWN